MSLWSNPVSVWRSALLLPFLFALGACGGGDSEFDPVQGPEVDAASYTLSTSEAALDLADPDLALVAALSAVSAGVNLRGSDYLDFNLLEGSGRELCDAGELEQSGGGQPFVIDFTLDTFQCYFDDPGLETILDGRVSVNATTGVGGDGEVGLGSGGSSFIGAIREGSALEFEFVQARGAIVFETPDNFTDFSSTEGARLIIGKAEPQSSSDLLMLDRHVEMLAGSTSTPFEIDTFFDTDELAVFGPMAIRGFGLDAGCNARGRFSVDTSDLVEISAGGEVSDGLLMLTNATSSASVRFTASGGAEVTTSAGGGPVIYSASQVETHCGLDSW